MYFYCICGKEGDLRVLLFCHLALSPYVSFKSLVDICISFSLKCLFMDVAHVLTGLLVFQLLCFEICTCLPVSIDTDILDTSPLICSWGIFSPLDSLSLHFLHSIFYNVRFSILMRSILSNCPLIDDGFNVRSKNSSPTPSFQRVSSTLFSKSFIVFCFTFKSMIYLCTLG